MGMDLYVKWDNQTVKQAANQITGWESAGNIGYLRGSYFGGTGDLLDDLVGFARGYRVWNLTIEDVEFMERQLDLTPQDKFDDEEFEEWKQFVAFCRSLVEKGAEPYLLIQR